MIIAANWKMNPPLADAGQLVSAYTQTNFDGVQRVLFPPHPYLVHMAMRLEGSGILLGGQDCHQSAAGAFTGDVAAGMLRECGASMVLLGHSERRAGHGESDELVAAKASAALEAGLSTMICIGESLDERERGRAEEVVSRQLDKSLPDGVPADRLVIAYEPVWAIGTGKVASETEIGAMHQSVRRQLAELGLGGVPILYGGSVKPDNAASILAIDDVGGALVGGASLKADDFAAICAAAELAV